MGRGVYRNYYGGYMDEIKGEGTVGGTVSIKDTWTKPRERVEAGE